MDVGHDERLTPIDCGRCQMTLGPLAIRCPNKPTWIAVGIKDGEFYSAMSLCGLCKLACETRMPEIGFKRLGHGGET